MFPAASPAVSFEQAARALRRLRPPTFDRACTGLEGVTGTLRVAGILAELAPEKLEPLSGEMLLDDSVARQMLEVALAAINQVAPLDESIEMDLDDLPGRLYPEPFGYPICWDDWGDMIENLADWEGVESTNGFWFFARCLIQGEKDSFAACAEHFGWDVWYPKKNDADTWLDWEKMVKALERRGMSCFVTAWKIAMYETDNVYWDYNPYDDNMDLPPFTIEGVRDLERQHQEACRIRTIYHEAQRLFSEDPGMPETLLGIYKNALTPCKKGGQTLAEVFTAEVERAREAGIEPTRTVMDDYGNPHLVEDVIFELPGEGGEEEDDDGTLDE